MRLFIVMVGVALAAPVSAHENDDCGAQLTPMMRDYDARIRALELNYEQATRLAAQPTPAFQSDSTARAFRLAAYTAGFTIGAVGGGLTSSEMTTKPGLVAAGTAIGAVIGTAFVLIVDQVFFGELALN